MTEKSLTVSEVNNYISHLISNDDILNELVITGEISNFKFHSSGHMYFSLKDEYSKIKCVMFRANNSSLKFMPEDGMSVIIYGNLKVYEKNGEYQIYVSFMNKAGYGLLYEKYTKLKEEFEKKGYFDQSQKKKPPFLPKRIAAVTSPTGAAIRDIISVISRRCPATEIIVCPVLVQGDSAADNISKMINYVNENDLADLIITGRGGGSIEELWAFNEPEVVESIFNSNIPVISAVGHETDFTLADFVADIRAATPSAAAELSVPDINMILKKINSHYDFISQTVFQKFDIFLKNILNLERQLKLYEPTKKIYENRQLIDEKYDALCNAVEAYFNLKNIKLDSIFSVLESLSPEKVLSRGYFALKDKDEYIMEKDIIVERDYKLESLNKIFDISVRNVIDKDSI